jgi:hypothetical protein
MERRALPDDVTTGQMHYPCNIGGVVRAANAPFGGKFRQLRTRAVAFTTVIIALTTMSPQLGLLGQMGLLGVVRFLKPDEVPSDITGRYSSSAYLPRTHSKSRTE